MVGWCCGLAPVAAAEPLHWLIPSIPTHQKIFPPWTREEGVCIGKGINEM
jgi:hypothetical protein